jgi:hypothetical protein
MFLQNRQREQYLHQSGHGRDYSDVPAGGKQAAILIDGK